MTEDEALTKQCCGAPCAADAVKYATGTLHGKDGEEPRWGMCVASACMAWRWRRVANPDWRQESMMSTYPQPNPFSNTNPQSVPSTTDGFCGLAGMSQ